ncbi:MAG: hypothetical protein ACKVOE_10290 [Rickettsiales bacterium]
MDQDELHAIERSAEFIRQYYLAPGLPAGIARTATPGVLVLDTGVEGPTVAVNALTHLSEPAGLAAQQQTIERWLKGPRPKAGKIYLTLGHPPQDAQDYLEDIIDRAKNNAPIYYDDGHYENMEHLATLAPYWRESRGNMLDIHGSVGLRDQPMVIPYMAVPFGTRWQSRVDPRERAECIYQDGIDLKATARRVSPLIARMPVRHVILDYYRYSAADPQLDAWFGGLAHMPESAMPLVLECGPSFSTAGRDTARVSAQAWLQNTLGWQAERQLPEVERYAYSGAHNLHHPQVYWKSSPKKFPMSHKEVHDTYYPLISPEQTHTIENPHHRATVERAYRDCEIDDTHLVNFEKIPARTPVAVGGKTGRLIEALEAGYPLFTAGNAVPPDSRHPSYLMAYATERQRMQDLLAVKKPSIRPGR